MKNTEVKGHYTVEDIRQTYDDAKAKEERHTEWVVYYLYRPLSFQITPWFLRLGLTPSNVTFISLILAFSLPLVAYWFPLPFVFVAIIAMMISVFDCVDGNIARVTGNTSKSGGYFDFLTDILYRILAYLAIGIMASQINDIPESIASIATEILLIAAMLAILARMCRMFVDVENNAESDDGKENTAKENSQSKGLLEGYFFPFLSGLDWGLPFLILISGVLGLFHWLVIWLLLYSLLDFLHTQYTSFSKLQSP